MKTVEVEICEPIYRDVYVEISDEFYEEMLKEDIDQKQFDELLDTAIDKIDNEDFYYEDYGDCEITHILETENWNVLYDKIKRFF